MTETANLIQSAVLDLKATTVTYAEYERRLTAGKYADPLKTRWGAALDKLERARRLEVDPPPSGWVVEPPRDPYTTITNAPTLALNAREPKAFADVKIDGTGDSAVLFQGNAHGSSLRRCEIRRAAITNAVPYGKHGIYAKARDLTIEDVDIECSIYCASGISLRMRGAQVRRFRIVGAPHCFSYYEYDDQPGGGTVLVENGYGEFTDSSAAIWMDGEVAAVGPGIRQAFIFRNGETFGPSTAKFLRVAAGTMRDNPVIVQNWIHNKRPVTAADVVGVPNLTVA